MGKALKLTDAKVLDISYRDFREQTPLNAEISREGALRNIAIVAAPGASRNIEDYCDMSFSEELRCDGFFAAMQAKYGRL